jgi:hypothetical protein
VNLGLNLGLGAQLLGGGFSPLTLFAAGEQGYWLDPSDFSTMFQDAAGTTPVTAVGQSVRLMLDKSQGLVPGPELIVDPSFDNPAAWTTTANTSVSGGVGRFVAPTVNGDNISEADPIALVSGVYYLVTYTITNYVSGLVRPETVGGTSISIGVSRAGNGTYTEYLLAQPLNTRVRLRTTSTNANLEIESLSVRAVAGNHFTQANVANAPILQADSGLNFLLFDGSDDWLQSAATINPGAVDKAQVFAGVRKLSDAAVGIVLESSASLAANNGTIQLLAPSTAGAPTYGFTSRGTSNGAATYNNAAVTAPVTNVVSGLADISAPSSILRVNGSQVGSNTSSQGTGNYLTYTHFIGRRNGATIPFNGRLYQMITRFGANLTADQIAATETFVNQRTGAY